MRIPLGDDLNSMPLLEFDRKPVHEQLGAAEGGRVSSQGVGEIQTDSHPPAARGVQGVPHPAG